MNYFLIFIAYLLVVYCLISALSLELRDKLLETGVIHACVSPLSKHIVRNVGGMYCLQCLVLQGKSHCTYSNGGTCRPIGNAWGKDNLALSSGHALFFLSKQRSAQTQTDIIFF